MRYGTTATPDVRERERVLFVISPAAFAERERGGVFFKTGRALAPALLSAEKPAVRFPAPAHLFVFSPVL